MACVIDQVVVFDETGKGSATCPSSFPEEPSDFSVSIDGQNLNYVGIFETMDYPMWAKGGTADNPIFPAVMFYNDLDGCWFVAAESEGTPIVGEHRISMCSSESDDDSCPDVPLSESIPEKYADYIDSEGNFVPKASSGGGGDCPYTTATLTVVNPNAPMLVPSVIVAPFDGETYINGGLNGSPYTVILYNGKALISSLGGFTNAHLEGDIERVSGQSYLIMTGDAKITFPTT